MRQGIADSLGPQASSLGCWVCSAERAELLAGSTDGGDVWTLTLGAVIAPCLPPVPLFLPKATFSPDCLEPLPSTGPLPIPH